MQLIPLSTSTATYRRLYFTTVDVNDLQVRLTDVDISAFTCLISKNGDTPVAMVNSPVEIDAGTQPGVWYIELDISEIDTLGLVSVTISAAEIETRELVAQIVPIDAFNETYDPDPPEAIPSPVVYGDPDYLDVVETAVARLPQQFRFSE